VNAREARNVEECKDRRGFTVVEKEQRRKDDALSNRSIKEKRGGRNIDATIADMNIRGRKRRKAEEKFGLQGTRGGKTPLPG